MRPILPILALLLLAAAPVAPPSVTPAAGTPIVLAARPGTQLDASARKLVAQDLTEARTGREKPLVLTGSAMLGTASDHPAVFVQLQSARECGSAGCSTTAFLWQKGVWKRILDGVDGKLTVLPTKTRGMADIASEKVKYIWTGTEYHDPKAAPPIDLRPRVK
jgi:hypothetical protein